MKEPRFLTALFYGQLKKVENHYVIGDNESFKFEIENETITDDDEYKIILLFKKKEWNDNEWSKVELTFINDDDLDRKSDLAFKHSLIPLNDKHGNPDQADNMKAFWRKWYLKD
eukprot:360689_1